MLNKPNIKPYIIGVKSSVGQNLNFKFRIFHFKPNYRARAHISGHFQTKINFSDVKSHFNYVKILETKDPWNLNNQRDRMTHLLGKYFLFMQCNRSRTKIVDPF